MGDAERPAEIRRLGAWWLEEVKGRTKVICQCPGESRIDICRSTPFRQDRAPFYSPVWATARRKTIANALSKWGRASAGSAARCRVHAIAWTRQRAALPADARPHFDKAFAIVLRRAVAQTGE